MLWVKLIRNTGIQENTHKYIRCGKYQPQNSLLNMPDIYIIIQIENSMGYFCSRLDPADEKKKGMKDKFKEMNKEEEKKTGEWKKEG